MSKKNNYEDMYSTAGDFDFDFGSTHVLAPLPEIVQTPADLDESKTATAPAEEESSTPTPKTTSSEAETLDTPNSQSNLDKSSSSDDETSSPEGSNSEADGTEDPDGGSKGTKGTDNTDSGDKGPKGSKKPKGTKRVAQQSVVSTETKRLSEYADIKEVLALDEEKKISFFDELMMIGNNIPRDLWFDLSTCAQLSEDAKNMRQAVHMALRIFVKEEKRKIDPELFASTRAQVLDRSIVNLYRKNKGKK